MDSNRFLRVLALVLAATLIGSCADAPPPSQPSAPSLFELAAETTGRDVLYVDDFGADRSGRVYEDCIPPPPDPSVPAGFPHDQCHDQFLREAIERGLVTIGHPDWVVDRYEPLDPVTGEVRTGAVAIDSTSFDYWVYDGPVTAENLLRYKAVIWNVRSESTSQLRVFSIAGGTNHLVTYLDAGGDLWLMGTGTFSRTLSDPSLVGLLPFGLAPEDFLYRYLNIHSLFEFSSCVGGCFRNSGSTVTYQRLHGFEGALADLQAAGEGFPNLRVSREPYVQPAQGIPACEGMVKPFGIVDTGAESPWTPIYYYQSNALLQLPPNSSYMDGSACALRYDAPGRGRLMAFGFPLYFMPEAADAVMAASLRWLLE